MTVLLWWLLVIVSLLIALALLPIRTYNRPWRAQRWGYAPSGAAWLLVIVIGLLLLIAVL